MYISTIFGFSADGSRSPLEKQSRTAKLARLTILDYVLRHCSFLDKKVLPSVLVSVFFPGFLTNSIWIIIETNTLATTVATVGKSGNLPVASFEYTFDHVADVDEDDNVDDVGEDDGVDDNFGEVRDDDVSEDDDTDCEGETLGTWCGG